MSIFKDSLGASRKDIKNVLKKMTDATSFVITGKQERIDMVDELFPVSVYGEKISPSEINRQIKALKSQKFQASDVKRMAKIEDKIAFLTKVLNS